MACVEVQDSGQAHCHAYVSVQLTLFFFDLSCVLIDDGVRVWVGVQIFR